MFRCISVLTALATCFISLVATAGEILNIGDAAPAITVSTWLKGERVRQFDPDKIYVVEFWATWCGPCRASIPHLTELAHQYKDKVQFIGVDVWEDDPAAAKPFVEQMGDKMDYTVAVDIMAAPSDNSSSDGGDSARGAMAKFWLAAAEEHGIPTAFVIQKGKIAWIGHPMELEEPLKKILAGDWNPAEMAKKRLVEKEKEHRVTLAQNKIRQPYQTKDYKALLVAVDEVLKENPDLYDEFIVYKLTALCNGGDIEPGLQLGNQLLEKYKDDAEQLTGCFLEVIDPDRIDDVEPRVTKLALRAFQRVVEVSKEQYPNGLYWLAEAQFRAGDAAAAFATQEKAISVAKSKMKEPDAPYLKQFTDHLARYRQAAAKKATSENTTDQKAADQRPADEKPNPDKQ